MKLKELATKLVCIDRANYGGTWVYIPIYTHAVRMHGVVMVRRHHDQSVDCMTMQSATCHGPSRRDNQGNGMGVDSHISGARPSSCLSCVGTCISESKWCEAAVANSLCSCWQRHLLTVACLERLSQVLLSALTTCLQQRKQPAALTLAVAYMFSSMAVQ